jgi:hypothetical protein
MDCKYVISNRRIAGVFSNWEWQEYDGSDPHTNHMHVSVGQGGDGKSIPPYDDTDEWTIKEEKEMTTLSPTSLRIIEAYVGGWDIGKSLNGDYDKTFTEAEGWKDPNEVIYRIFLNAGDWRAKVLALQDGSSESEAQKKLTALQAQLKKLAEE